MEMVVKVVVALVVMVMVVMIIVIMIMVIMVCVIVSCVSMVRMVVFFVSMPVIMAAVRVTMTMVSVAKGCHADEVDN